MTTSLVLLLLLVLIPDSSTLIRSSLEERFLRSLDQGDAVFYFGSSSADSGKLLNKKPGEPPVTFLLITLFLSFGINHDGMDNTCGRSGFMMASDGGYNSVDLTWSAWERECVKDLPVLEGSLQDWKPGLYYGVDDQCRIAFGSTRHGLFFLQPGPAGVSSSVLSRDPGDKSSCKRLLVPLLDGTECAPNQVRGCVRAFVEGTLRLPGHLGSSVVVHGSWSSWSELSSCSRTCGGGVQHRTRLCNNPRPAFRGRDCEGRDTEAGLCHQQACERSQLDLMAEQCSLTDPQPLSLTPGTANLYTWIPALGFVTGDEQCKYMCQSEGEDFLVSRGSQFVDGTRCEPDSPAPLGSTPACLSGKCQLFGCDGVLHSGKVEDMCGECGGNGSSCSLVSQSYTGGQAREYATFLTLPMNATQVHIVNEAPVFTHMAVLVGGQYVVSGHGSMSLNITHPSILEDQRLEYRIYLTSDLLPYMEELKVPGPIREETHVQVYRKYGKEYGGQTSPNITYRYYAPGAPPEAGWAEGPRGSWSSVPTPCSVTCSSGVQKHVHVCVDGDTKEHLDERFCETAPPTPPQQTACHLPACPSRWEAGEFGPCSAPCGGGEALRPVRCVQRQGGEVVQVPTSECPPDSAPATTDSCNLQPCPVRWHAAEPGECSAVCGPGEARRAVTCVRSEGGRDSEVDPSLCPEDIRPPDSEPCVVDVCPLGWESKGEALLALKKTPGLTPRSGPPRPVYVWSPVIGQCSKTCGNGTLLVWFFCVDHQTRRASPEMHCESSNKPAPRSEACNPSPCPPTWHYKEGACSVTCGGGVANRVLYCSRQGEEEGEEEVVEDAECSASHKPTAVVSCHTNSCPARWRVQKTGACSVTCGLGVAQRSVACVQFARGREGQVAEEACSAATVKPATAVPCLLQLCTFSWEAKAWGQCSVSCGYGVQSRAVWCMGPSTAQPLNPMLCMHRPKPITIQGCRFADCRDPQRPTHLPTSPPPLATSQSAAPKKRSEVAAPQERPFLPPLDPTETPRDPTTTPLPLHPSETTLPHTPSSAPSSTPKTSVCGRLLLQDSGTVDLRQETGRCILSIGRPLGELIHIKVESSALNCKKKEYVTFYDRLALNRKCGPMEGTVLTTRTNVLLVRQNLVTPGNGVLLTYSSQKNSKRSLHQETCDTQLFGPSGVIENPTMTSVSDSHTCRVLINAPPSVKIRIQARSLEPVVNASSTQDTYIMIRDVDVLKTNVFKGHQLFLWLSSGSMAEIEFHGAYLYTTGSFKAEYSFVRP
ncbi:A disintegrin and metalloproteinase with thrombospondin motifs 13 [Osmerus mordax]|uniref:A disintegrin and metalloproteinase with thrombospondin motifs 13 n=1 Tax=Osmerus mordax TaxID=8014 RepID=UPI00350F4A68